MMKGIGGGCGGLIGGAQRVRQRGDGPYISL